jgi:hypothetical protein
LPNRVDRSFPGWVAGDPRRVKLRKVIQKQIRRDADGVSVAGGLNAVVSANVNEPGTTETSVRTKTRIVQRNGRTEVFETESDSGPGKKEEPK